MSKESKITLADRFNRLKGKVKSKPSTAKDILMADPKNLFLKAIDEQVVILKSDKPLESRWVKEVKDTGLIFVRFGRPLTVPFFGELGFEVATIEEAIEELLTIREGVEANHEGMADLVIKTYKSKPARKPRTTKAA